MYREELNGFFPLALIQKEYRKHLAPRLTVKNEVFTSNQDVENLLVNNKLMKSIRNEIEENSLNRQHESVDEEINTRRFSRPSKERDYEIIR